MRTARSSAAFPIGCTQLVRPILDLGAGVDRMLEVERGSLYFLAGLAIVREVASRVLRCRSRDESVGS